MKSLLDILFSNYFVIDETKMQIFSPGREKEENGKAQEEKEDLITLISRIMVENEKLQNIQETLETKKNSTRELEGFMKKMITLLDGFERTLKLARKYPPSEEIDNWLKSVETTYYRLYNILEKYGLKALDTIGKHVNLDYHDVVEYIPSSDYPPDTVISERQKGYLFRGKLIRDAKVVVGYNPNGN